MPQHVGFVGVQHRVDEVKANRGVWCMILSSREMVKDEEVRLVAKLINALLSVKFGRSETNLLRASRHPISY